MAIKIKTLQQDYDEVRKFCGNCKFFYYDGDADIFGAYGECKRYPPVYVGEERNDEVISSWMQPQVSMTISVCGEWKEGVDRSV